MRQVQYTAEHMWTTRQPSVKRIRAVAAVLARRCYRKAKREGAKRYLALPFTANDSRLVTLVKCKRPARGVPVRALQAYLMFHPRTMREAFVVRVDLLSEHN